MIDLETWGKTPGCAIASIGAVFFDPYANYEDDLPHDLPMLYRNVSLDSCLKIGLEVEEGSTLWWMKQGEEARIALTDPKPISIHNAIRSLRDFYWDQKDAIGKKTPIHVWSHGLTFDLPFIAIAAKKASMEEPWLYNYCRDTRTLFDLAFDGKKPKFQENEVKHNALHDSVTQVIQVQEAYRALNKTRK